MPTATLETRALAAPAAFRPKSADEKNRTVDAVLATPAPVGRRDGDGEFSEVLTIATEAIDLTRLEAGIPLLNSHAAADLGDVLGRVIAARVEGEALVGTIRFSERAADLYRDVVEGLLGSMSVGYQVLSFHDEVDAETGARTRFVERWALVEASLTAISADPGATTRSATMPNPNPPAPAATPPAPQTETRAQRNREIRALGRQFGVAQEAIDGLIDRDGSVDEARSLAIEASRAAASLAGPIVTMGFCAENPEVLTRAMGEALHCRANPGERPSEAAKPFLGLSLVDIARQSLQMRSISTVGLSTNDLLTRALNTTSDFPLILADTANRSLLPAYEAAPAALKQVAKQSTARDFRAKMALRLGEAAALEKVGEDGEYKYSAISESGESYGVNTFGKIFGISRRALVNDDISAFVDLAGQMGAAAADFEASFLVDLLELNSGAGPVMADTVTLFHADHNNVAEGTAGYGDPGNLVRLSSARTAMRRQTGLSGRPINATPAYIVVPAELETSAEAIVAEIAATTISEVNPFSKKLQVLTEARLASATRWYLFADPAVLPTLEYSYLSGSEGPMTESRTGWEIDGLEFKVRLDFGAGAIDHRGAYMNEG
ncbi:MAG: prohead protease/major capsid protein fusion protein [Pseudomonadota bacterium]|nr:prohead protease/major capsid protein fusion protein [Pseudomonadota bacterium]